SKKPVTLVRYFSGHDAKRDATSRSMLIETGLVGLFGLIGMTWVFPVAGRVIASLRRRVDPATEAAAPLAAPLRLSILIPAHNEEHSILETLQSVAAAVDKAKVSVPGLEASIIVGADGCTDSTAR